MKVVILAGGIGSRLRPLTFSIPKPLLPVGEKPILEIILSKLKSQGFKDIVLAVGYRSELIKTYFEDGSKFGVDIKYVDEDEPMGTAGSLGLVKEKFDINGPIILMNGDILTRLNFNKMIDFHVENGADITVGIKKHEQKSPFGVINLDGNVIRGMKEKPKFVFNASAGIYVLSPSVLESIPIGTPYQMPDLIKDAMNSGKKVLGYRINEYWIAVEHMGNFQEALNEIEKWE
jgi:NDP-sugar pyrophosphorylase family protein